MTSSFKLTVNKPCSQIWNNMLPKQHGRFCEACSTTVTDFSAMTDEQVIHFFLLNNQQPVCGRFKISQLDKIEIVVPEYLLQKKITPWKKYLLLLLIVFSTELLPANVIFKTSGNLYAQTTQTVKKKKQKKKRFRNKRRIVPEEIICTGMMIFGFTQTVPKEYPIEKLEAGKRTPAKQVLRVDSNPANNSNRENKSKNSRWAYTAALPGRRRKRKQLQ